jgi:hypothetical protein
MLDWLKLVDAYDELKNYEKQALEAPLGKLHGQSQVNFSWMAEGLAVLAWALQRYEIPSHDVYDVPADIATALGFMSQDAKLLAKEASLLPYSKLKKYQDQAFAIHWRLREFGLKPAPMNFMRFAKEAWFGPLDIKLTQLVGNDLSIKGKAIADADSEDIRLCISSARERHRAINWLLDGDELFSEARTDT